MKILLAHNFYRSSAPSGEDAVYQAESALLESMGHELIRFEKHNDDLQDSSLQQKLHIGLDTAWSKAAYAELTELIRKTRPDIAHFHNTFPQLSPSVYLACRQQGVPVVQTLHNFRTVCANGLLLRNGQACERCLALPLLPALQHRCYRHSLTATSALVWMQARNRLSGTYRHLVNRYIALTEFAASRLSRGGLPFDKIVIKPNFIDHLPVLPTAKQPYAVYVGRLTPEKGIRTLLDAWRGIRDFPLRVIGDGELRPVLEQQARQENLQVQFHGYLPREKVLAQVAGAQLQVIPSECYEGFPLVVLEAFACETPVLASAIGSLDELVDQGVTGVKFQPGDAGDLRSKIQALQANAGVCREMGKRAREHLLARYMKERNYAQLLQIYCDAQADCLQARQ